MIELSSKESTCNGGTAGDVGSGRSPGGGHGNPLQYSCLENSMDRGAWRATVHGVAKSLGQEDPLEKGNGNLLQYSCLENSMDRGAWRATVHEVVKTKT